MNWRKLAQRLLFPHRAAAALLTAIAAAGMIYVSVKLDSAHPVGIAVYALSFYALTIFCLRIPAMIAAAKRFRRENRYYLRFSSDVRLRMNISLFGACVYNAGYAAFQLALGLRHHSAWFYAMAGYYCLLAALRLMLGRYIRAHVPREEKRTEWKKYRLCGVGLLLMNEALLVFVFYLVYDLRAVRHFEITVIAMAAYTFGALTLAIANVVRYRRYDSPVCSAAKALSLAAAVVSMLSLEDAMLTTFGKCDQTLFRPIVMGASGVAASLFILSMAIYMIVRASKNLKNE